jgi:hypothetical protein
LRCSSPGFALYAQRRYTFDGHPFGAKEVGCVFAWVGFPGLILQGGLIDRLVKLFGERTLVWMGFAISATGYGLPAWIRTVWGTAGRMHGELLQRSSPACRHVADHTPGRQPRAGRAAGVDAIDHFGFADRGTGNCGQPD